MSNAVATIFAKSSDRMVNRAIHQHPNAGQAMDRLLADLNRFDPADKGSLAEREVETIAAIEAEDRAALREWASGVENPQPSGTTVADVEALPSVVHDDDRVEHAERWGDFD